MCYAFLGITLVVVYKEWTQDAIPEKNFATMQDDIILFLVLYNGLVLVACTIATMVQRGNA